MASRRFVAILNGLNEQQTKKSSPPCIFYAPFADRKTPIAKRTRVRAIYPRHSLAATYPDLSCHSRGHSHAHSRGHSLTHSTTHAACAASHACHSRGHSPTHSLTPLAQPLTRATREATHSRHSLTRHSRGRSLAHLRGHSLTHSTTHAACAASHACHSEATHILTHSLTHSRRLRSHSLAPLARPLIRATRSLATREATLRLELRDLAEHMSAQALRVRLFGQQIRRAVALLHRIELTQLFMELL